MFRQLSIFVGLFFSITLAFAQTTTINGVAVLVDYQIRTVQESDQYMDDLFNKPGFTENGQFSSVRDYYLAQTNGKIEINTEIIRVRLPERATYYHGENGNSQDFKDDLFAAIDSVKPEGFSGLTLRPDGTIRHFCIISRGAQSHHAAGGMGAAHYLRNNGVQVPVNSFFRSTTVNTSSLHTVSTICHEMGHSVFGWTDYYRTHVSNLGEYCVMASAGTNMPMILNPALRYIEGWQDSVIILDNTTTQTHQVIANSYNQVFKYPNPHNPEEYLIISAYIDGGYYLPEKSEDEGLTIFYVDENGGYAGERQDAAPIIHLIQADGLDELADEDSDDVRGDSTDLFDHIFNEFSEDTHPFRWKNGGKHGLILTNISAPDSVMTFTVEKYADNTIHAQSEDVQGGNLSPNGLVGYDNGKSKTISILPEIGYQISNVYVNGINQGPVSTYTFSNTNSVDSISATFHKLSAIDTIPAPWQTTNIGNSRRGNYSAHRNGQFRLESSSYDIWNTSDNFHYVYQTLSGDGEIIAHIDEMNKPHEWSKAGIMIRESLTEGSKHFMVTKTPYNSIRVQLRPATNGSSVDNPDNLNELHHQNLYNWLKIVREGNVITGYCSRDTSGGEWFELGDYTISMNNTVYVGMAAGPASDEANLNVIYSGVTVTPYSSGDNLLDDYNVPRTSGLPSVMKSYDYAHVVGTGGPDLDNVNDVTINWDLPNNGLWQLSFSTNNGQPDWYNNMLMYSTHNLSQASPQITINGNSGFSDLEGNYYVNTYNTNDLVLVEESGEYAIIFSDSPSVAKTAITNSEENELEAIEAYPNPFSNTISIVLPANTAASVTVSDTQGKTIEQFNTTGNTSIGQGYESGLYFIQVNTKAYSKVITVKKQ